MRRLLVSLTALLAVPVATAAPALGEKAPRWEYAELHVQRSVAIRPILPPGGAAAPAAPAAANTTIRWTTLDEEVTAESWDQLADKLKAPASRHEGSANIHKLRVFNRLGADGWEMTQHTGTDGTTGTATWVFKRRVP